MVVINAQSFLIPDEAWNLEVRRVVLNDVSSVSLYQLMRSNDRYFSFKDSLKKLGIYQVPVLDLMPPSLDPRWDGLMARTLAISLNPILELNFDVIVLAGRKVASAFMLSPSIQFGERVDNFIVIPEMSSHTLIWKNQNDISLIRKKINESLFK